jgi:hypothetical protein
MRIYGPDDVPALRERLGKADRISGFNIFNFDIPVVFGLPRHGRVESVTPKVDDMLRRIWKSLGLNPDVFSDRHKGWGLDVVAGATLGARKIGYGGDAPKWFQDGKWARLVGYCVDDVCLERDLVDFVDRYGYVVGGNGRKVAIATWESGCHDRR